MENGGISEETLFHLERSITMLKGILMASGWITLYALYGAKNFDGGKGNKKMLGYSMLNVLWLVAVLGAIFVDDGIVTRLILIAVAVAYPIIITACGIKNRKKGVTSFTGEQNVSVAQGMSETEKEYILENNISKEIVLCCEANTAMENKRFLHEKLREGKLSETHFSILWDKYCK